MEDSNENVPDDDCLYNVLGVEKSSSSSEIRSAYRKLAMKWHPDKCSTSEEKQAKDKFQGIQEAYSVLSDDKKRVLYDSGLYDGGDDEGMQSFMSEMVSMMSANTTKSSFGELKNMFDQMVDSYACPVSGPSTSTCFSSSSDNLFSASSLKSDKELPILGRCNSQNFCMGRQEEADRQRLHKKHHRRRKSPYNQGTRASTCNKVDS